MLPSRKQCISPKEKQKAFLWFCLPLPPRPGFTSIFASPEQLSTSAVCFSSSHPSQASLPSPRPLSTKADSEVTELLGLPQPSVPSPYLQRFSTFDISPRLPGSNLFSWPLKCHSPVSATLVPPSRFLWPVLFSPVEEVRAQSFYLFSCCFETRSHYVEPGWPQTSRGPPPPPPKRSKFVCACVCSQVQLYQSKNSAPAGVALFHCRSLPITTNLAYHGCSFSVHQHMKQGHTTEGLNYLPSKDALDHSKVPLACFLHKQPKHLMVFVLQIIKGSTQKAIQL